MKKRLLLILLLLTGIVTLNAQKTIRFGNVNEGTGFKIEKSDPTGITVTFTVPEVTFTEVTINGERMTEVGVPGIFLPNNEGAPNLPGTGRYLLIPNGAEASLEILDFTTELIPNVNVSPAPRIPKENENGLEYRKNPKVYGKDLMYPAEFARLSAPVVVRGWNMVMLGITPFQYNPVSKDLLVYKTVTVRIHTEGGGQTFADARFRSRWFDPLIEDMVLNPEVLPAFDYNAPPSGPADVAGCEYLIICPTGAVFQQWADTIRRFREMQGIHTLVKTMADVGANTPAALEAYINTVFNTWTPVPAAILLLGDYGTDASTSITSPIWDSYCVSDNILGDVNNDDMPDIVMARITAQNAAQLQVMVKKFINYELSPPTDEGFYEHPITALGWQTERWFQICTEVVGGFWANALGKTPVRVNAVYGGNPLTDPWSTATNTTTVVNYFGPSGLGYIPTSPQSLGGFSGGTPAMINTALNSGAFMLQHRDHGYEQGWGEPAYNNSSISGLTNTELSFIMSVNCLTGKYDYSSEVFAEKFHRYTYNGNASGALGLLAASEISYSFVNDVFVWGMYDNMWPNFMPGYGTNPASRGILPAFGNAAGKFFLAQSSWPYNTGNKEVTYHLFHHHGDAFLTVYSEVPQYLTVNHDPVIYTGVTSFTVTANTGALICLSLNGQILGTATGTGVPQSIPISGTQLPPDYVDIVVTLQNYYRYHAQIQVIPPSGPYVVKDAVSLNDATTGNNNGQADYGESLYLSLGMRNVGVVNAPNTMVSISTSSPYVTIADPDESYGTIIAGATVNIPSGFGISLSPGVPDNTLIPFTVTAVSGSNTWVSYFSLTAHAPVLAYQSHTLADPSGNGNNKLDPGETVTLTIVAQNTGSSGAQQLSGTLICSSPWISLNTASQSYGAVPAGASLGAAFTITAAPGTPAGHMAGFQLQFSGAHGQSLSQTFQIVVGQIPVLVIDLDGNSNSAPDILQAVLANGLSAESTTSIPSNLNQYASIFLCLGIFSDNHALTASEGNAFAAYLSAGGKLYMEGGDCWAYDAQTALQPMFNISGLSDGSGDAGTLNGVGGTLTDGLSFNYSGDNNWMDRLGIVSGSTAFTILNNLSPAYVTGIAYNGGTYRTIGVSHEFGGLSGANAASSQSSLMLRYLEFFGLISNLNAGFTASDTLIFPGETIAFTSTSTGTISSYQWAFPGGNPATSTQSTPSVTYANPGVYDVSLTVGNPYASHSLTKTGYIVVGINSFSGQIHYDNSLLSPMNNTTVNLVQGTNVVYSTTTDASGNFSFDNIPLGTYTLQPQCTKPWGGGNGTDALLITKHFVGMSTLTGVRRQAGDIDNSAYVNTVDALGVQRRFIQMISSFPSGDWAFENPVISLTGSALEPVSIKTVCFGDVNGSFTPATNMGSAVSLTPEGNLLLSPGEIFTLSLSARFERIGAASLFLEIPDCYELLDVLGPEGAENQPVFALRQGILGITWIDGGNPEDAFSLSLKLRLVSADLKPVQLALPAFAEFADPDGKVFEALGLTLPELRLRTPDEIAFNVIPNPVTESCVLEFDNPEGSQSRILVLSSDGRLLNTLVFESNVTQSNWKPVNARGDLLQNGVYLLRLINSGQTRLQKLIISR